MGLSGVAASAMPAGSAAWAQQPQVTQVGGQAPSSLPARSDVVQGSSTTRLVNPEAVTARAPTTRARRNLRTA